MIDRLEMFIALATEQHFGRAAASLGITQPSLSAGIKSLEAQLGVPLVFRGTRYGGLTPEGQRALVWARRIVGDTRQLREEMRVTRHGLSGRLRLGVIPTAQTLAAALAHRFRARHPRMRLAIVTRTSEQMLAMIDNLELDAGLSYIGNEPVGRAVIEPVGDERFMLICRAGHAFARRDHVGWDELDGHDLALLPPDMQNRRIINRNLHAVGVEVEPVIETDSTLVLVSEVAAGGPMTILPRAIAAFLIAGKPLAAVPLSGGLPNPEVGLLALHRDPPTPAIAALLLEARRMRRELIGVSDHATGD